MKRTLIVLLTLGAMNSFAQSRVYRPHSCEGATCTTTRTSTMSTTSLQQICSQGTLDYLDGALSALEDYVTLPERAQHIQPLQLKIDDVQNILVVYPTINPRVSAAFLELLQDLEEKENFLNRLRSIPAYRDVVNEIKLMAMIVQREVQ